jgi:hypothetical protein
VPHDRPDDLAPHGARSFSQEPGFFLQGSVPHEKPDPGGLMEHGTIFSNLRDAAGKLHLNCNIPGKELAFAGIENDIDNRAT